VDARAGPGGLVARGANYLLVGSLAVQIAFSSGGKQADTTGALRAVAGHPGGIVVLWLLAAGFAGPALWRFAETAYGQAGPVGRTAPQAAGVAGAGSALWLPQWWASRWTRSSPAAGQTAGLPRRHPGCGTARAGEGAAEHGRSGGPDLQRWVHWLPRPAPARTTPSAMPAEGGCRLAAVMGAPAAVVPSTTVAGIGSTGIARPCPAGFAGPGPAWQRPGKEEL
jgi:hypothetical protein